MPGSYAVTVLRPVALAAVERRVRAVHQHVLRRRVRGEVATPMETVTWPPGWLGRRSVTGSATARRSFSATSTALALDTWGSSSTNSSPP